ncbi:MAG: hypothetical protein DSY81_06265 [Bacillota bacterium]|nr:MAG: hypothetical protein DSY92_07575 [Planctomycetota bacterium]RUA09437.1 MAG: hypothetical protein DSY81_06265 [Bacillota bacterium]
MPDRNLTPIATGLVAMVLVIALLLSGCNPANGVRDGEDAVEAAQTITRNRTIVDRIISDVMEEFDEDNPDSIVQGIKKYEDAVLLLDEAVRLAPISTQPRLERFRLRKRIASGYHYLYAVADEECKPLEDDNLVVPVDLLERRAAAKAGSRRWFLLSIRDMKRHLQSSPISYQNPTQYWDLQQCHVALGNYNGARNTLLDLLSAYGSRLSTRDIREIESRIRLYAQKMLDAEI